MPDDHVHVWSPPANPARCPCGCGEYDDPWECWRCDALEYLHYITPAFTGTATVINRRAIDT